MKDLTDGGPEPPVDEIEEALEPIEELSYGIVPDAGGAEIVAYDGARHELRYRAADQGMQSGLGLATALVFLVALAPTAPGVIAPLLLGLLGFGGGALGAYKGFQCMSTLMELRRQDPRLYLPEGLTEADARFENQARFTVGDWNDAAGRWNVDAGDLKHRYLTWLCETFREERLEEGLTPAAALAEYAALRRESERLAKPDADAKAREAGVRELDELLHRWLARTFEPAALEAGLTPEQVRIEYEAFRREAAKLTEARAAIEAQGERISGKLRNFSRRVLAAPQREEKLLPPAEPETLTDEDDG